MKNFSEQVLISSSYLPHQYSSTTWFARVWMSAWAMKMGEKGSRPAFEYRCIGNVRVLHHIEWRYLRASLSHSLVGDMSDVKFSLGQACICHSETCANFDTCVWDAVTTWVEITWVSTNRWNRSTFLYFFLNWHQNRKSDFPRWVQNVAKLKQFSSIFLLGSHSCQMWRTGFSWCSWRCVLLGCFCCF